MSEKVSVVTTNHEPQARYAARRASVRGRRARHTRPASSRMMAVGMSHEI